jgi:ABC-type glycerol-3-phosphate transport system substrate-binding protein
MQIDKDSRIPLYKQVKKYLLDYIGSNSRGSLQMPTEEEISRKFEVSRGTVKTAVKELVQEGILKRVPGKGTFIDLALNSLSFATWLSLEDYTAAPLSSAVSDYLDKNKNAEVDITSVPYEKFEHQLILMTAAGKAPDLASMVYLWLPAFAHQGALLPVDNLKPADFEETAYPNSRLAASYNGRRYGFTLANGPALLFYNRDVLENICGRADAAIEDYDELTETSAAVYEKSKGEIVPFSIPIADDELFFLYTIYNFLLGFGGGIIDEEGKVSFHSEGNITAFSWLGKFIEKGHVSTKNNFREERYLFAEKKIAFSIEAPWLKGIIPTLNPWFPPESLGFSTLPKGPRGIRSAVLYNIILTIFKQNKSPERAADLAAHLCRDPETCRRFYTEAGLFPGYRDITENDPVYDDSFGRVLREQMKTAVPVPSNHPSFLLSIVFCAKASREILIGGRAPAPVLNNTAEVLQELYRQ